MYLIHSSYTYITRGVYTLTLIILSIVVVWEKGGSKTVVIGTHIATRYFLAHRDLKLFRINEWETRNIKATDILWVLVYLSEFIVVIRFGRALPQIIVLSELKNNYFSFPILDIYIICISFSKHNSWKWKKIHFLPPKVYTILSIHCSKYCNFLQKIHYVYFVAFFLFIKIHTWKIYTMNL